MRSQSIAVLAVLLCGCSGGGGDEGGGSQANQYCFTVASAGGATCENCAQVTDTGAAFDGDLGTAASMGAGGQGTFSGNVGLQPAGRVAGVFFVLQDPPGISVSISTYRSGTLQDTAGPSTRSANSDACVTFMECFYNDGAGSFIGLQTTKPYDRISATISNTGVDPLSINELCLR